MAGVAKVTLNGETLIDVTGKTVTTGTMVSGITALSKNGDSITGTIATKSSADLTASGSTVTVPAGFYSSQVTKNVTSATAFKPAITLTSSTGVITGTNTFTSAYYASSTTTSTLNLTTQAAQTINTSTADQTIASYRWLTGTQTIKSVTTTNLTAANIAEGVTVKVGDANNASRITQVVGTHSGATSYTATISGSGNASYCYVTYNSTKYYTSGNTFTYKAGDTLTIYSRGNSVTVNGDAVTLSNYTYTYTLPVGDITIDLSYTSSSSNNIKVWGLVQPTGTYTINASGTHNVYKYSAASVAAGSAFPPSTTITTNPTVTIASTTGVVTATYTGSSSITPTVTSGYISQGTAGTISTTGTNTLNLTTQAAQTINTSTADQTIASYRWLTGTQTIKSVTTTNLTAANVAEGVTVKVGDANNASRITQVTGTYVGSAYYTATISGSGNSSYCYVTYNGTKYYTNGNTFSYKAGDTLTIYSRGNSVTINGDAVTLSSYSYTYTLPVGDITINLSYTSSTSNNIKVWGLVQPTGTYEITASGTHNVYKYSAASVAGGTAFAPAITLASSTGVVTGTNTFAAGYYTASTKTSTFNLTTQAAQTINTSTADQTIASYRWLTGTQTIKSVTTSNLTAANIKSGVTVKVGDANNSSRITQITGTYEGTVINNQNKSFTPDETGASITADTGYTGLGTVTVAGISSTYVGTGVARKSAADLTANLSTVTVPAGYYSSQVTKNVTSATAFAPAVTITSSTGVVTGTNTFTSAYYAASTKTSTVNLTTQAAQTLYPSTADQTIASYRWLTGNQTIKSVVTTNLTAANIASGVTVKIGDSSNASRITQITGTYVGMITTYTVDEDDRNLIISEQGYNDIPNGNTESF